MKDTFADVTKIKEIYDWEPEMNIEYGIERYAKWFLEYYIN